jgi:hypothetical protein
VQINALLRNPSSTFLSVIQVDIYLDYARYKYTHKWNYSKGSGGCTVERMAVEPKKCGLASAAPLLTSLCAFSTGGPQTDIVDVGANGFLATTAEEYAKCLKEVLRADGRNFSGMQADGRRKADLFSDERFRQGFVEALERGIQETKKQR